MIVPPVIATVEDLSPEMAGSEDIPSLLIVSQPSPEIKREEKKVVIRDLQNQNTYTETYDKLILAPGASPILPAGIGGYTASRFPCV